MGMGFILPFALTFIAIPLESFIHSSRTVIGVVLAGFLRVTAVTLRFLGNISKYLGKSLVNIYDLFIFFPLWVEGAVGSKAGRADDKRESSMVTSLLQEKPKKTVRKSNVKKSAEVSDEAAGIKESV